MKFEGLTILIISPDSWSALPVSKHHYAIELAKQNNVYFIDPDSHFSNIKEEKGVNVFGGYRRVKGLSRLPVAVERRLMKIEVASIMNKCNIRQIDIVWSFDTSRLYYLDLFKARYKIAHIVDFTEDFSFKELISSADICFATSDSILSKIGRYNPNNHKVNHGFVGEKNSVIPNAFEKNKGIYIGNLTIQYLDWKSLYQIVSNFSDMTFEFIGSQNGVLPHEQGDYMKRVADSKNVFFYNPIPPDEVNERLASADFCIMAYDVGKHSKQLQNPHKLMQYLGSGKPIFASFTHEYRDTDLIYMYGTEEDVVKSFSAFLSDENEMFSKGAAEKRIKFAQQHTYANQINKIELLLEKKTNADGK